MIIQGSVWFSTPAGETIGIVMGQDPITKQKKAYIGVGSGHNEYIDQEVIAEHGAPIHPQTLERLADHFKVDPKQ